MWIVEQLHSWDFWIGVRCNVMQYDGPTKIWTINVFAEKCIWCMLCAGKVCEEGTEMVTMPDFTETELPDVENRIREGLFELREGGSFTPLSVQFTVTNAVRVIISVIPGDVVEVWPLLDKCCGIFSLALWWWLFLCIQGFVGEIMTESLPALRINFYIIFFIEDQLAQASFTL